MTDLQRRLAYGAKATNRHVEHLNPDVGGDCPFYDMEETVDHLFIICHRLEGLFKLLND